MDRLIAEGMAETVVENMDERMAETVGVVTGVGVHSVKVDGKWLSFVQAAVAARAQGRYLVEIKGKEGVLSCSGGHSGFWVLTRQVGTRLDLSCFARVERSGEAAKRCRQRGTAYLGGKVGFRPGAASYSTLQGVVLALGERPNSTARQAALNAGQVAGCIARLLRRELVVALPGTTIPTGRRTTMYSLTEAGQAYFGFYTRAVPS